MGLMANYGVGGFSDEVYYARRGMRITRWVDGLVPGAAPVNLANPGIIYNLVADEDVYITQVQYGIDTFNDDVTFELVWTTAANAAGAWTQIDIQEHIFTGAALAGNIVEWREINPPHLLRYEDGVRCITLRVDANDAAARIRVGWDGWSECCGCGTTTSTSSSTTSSSTSTTSTSSSTTSTSLSTTSTSTTSTSLSTTSTSVSTTSTSTTSTSQSTSTSISTTSTSQSTSTSISTTSTSLSTTSTSTTSTSLSTTSTSTTSTSLSTTSTSTTSTSQSTSTSTTSTSTTSTSTTLRPD